MAGVGGGVEAGSAVRMLLGMHGRLPAGGEGDGKGSDFQCEKEESEVEEER